jgi:predicted DNA-binding protein
MARPKIVELQKKRSIRFHDEDWERIKDLASRAALSPSEFIRRAALQKRIRSRVNLKAIAELRRLGGLQKYCLQQIVQAPGEASSRSNLNETLAAILKAIKQLDSVDQEG